MNNIGSGFDFDPEKFKLESHEKFEQVLNGAGQPATPHVDRVRKFAMGQISELVGTNSEMDIGRAVQSLGGTRSTTITWLHRLDEIGQELQSCPKADVPLVLQDLVDHLELLNDPEYKTVSTHLGQNVTAQITGLKAKLTDSGVTRLNPEDRGKSDQELTQAEAKQAQQALKDMAERMDSQVSSAIDQILGASDQPTTTNKISELVQQRFDPQTTPARRKSLMHQLDKTATLQAERVQLLKNFTDDLDALEGKGKIDADQRHQMQAEARKLIDKSYERGARSKAGVMRLRVGLLGLLIKAHASRAHEAVSDASKRLSKRVSVGPVKGAPSMPTVGGAAVDPATARKEMKSANDRLRRDASATNSISNHSAAQATMHYWVSKAEAVGGEFGQQVRALYDNMNNHFRDVSPEGTEKEFLKSIFAEAVQLIDQYEAAEAARPPETVQGAPAGIGQAKTPLARKQHRMEKRTEFMKQRIQQPPATRQQILKANEALTSSLKQGAALQGRISDAALKSHLETWRKAVGFGGLEQAIWQIESDYYDQLEAEGADQTSVTAQTVAKMLDLIGQCPNGVYKPTADTRSNAPSAVEAAGLGDMLEQLDDVAQMSDIDFDILEALDITDEDRLNKALGPLFESKTYQAAASPEARADAAVLEVLDRDGATPKEIVEAIKQWAEALEETEGYKAAQALADLADVELETISGEELVSELALVQDHVRKEIDRREV